MMVSPSVRALPRPPPALIRVSRTVPTAASTDKNEAPMAAVGDVWGWYHNGGPCPQSPPDAP